MPAQRAHRPAPRAFTLIELLIVVAIIAILSAIAVPNLLEAQTRSKVSRAKADMRSLTTALEAYRADYNRPAPAFERFSGGGADPGNPNDWWGFTPTAITTPVAYMTSLPATPFPDRIVLGFWRNFVGPMASAENQPYSYIYDTRVMTADPSGRNFSLSYFQQASLVSSYWPPEVQAIFQSRPYRPSEHVDFGRNLMRSSYVVYAAGPDGLDCTFYRTPVTYDPTNGTSSFGDLYAFGGGSPESTGHSNSFPNS